MRDVTVKIGSLFDAISVKEGNKFEVDREYFQKTPIEIKNENGDWCRVVGLIIKTDKLRSLSWSDGSVTECADKHWIRVHGSDCKLASDIVVGDEIERADGVNLVCMSNELTDEIHTFYDMQIDTPSHLYQTADGIVHHNTLLAQSIARMLDVPFAITDATTLTAAGYVGEDVESIVAKLLQNADYDVKKAERGIIFIDEIDKIGRKSDSPSITRDVSGEDVQQGLLKMIEGTECRVPPQGGRKHPQQEMTTINTKNILFVASGAFVGLDEIVAQRQSKKNSIGFNATVGSTTLSEEDRIELLKKVEPADFIKFGMIPEFVGRFHIQTCVSDLTEEQLVSILTEPKNAVVKQYIKMFKVEQVDLEFTHDALVEIAKICKQRKTGARGLRSVIEKCLLPVQYNLPDYKDEGVEKIIVGADVIRGTGEPLKVYNKKKESNVSS